MINLRNLQEVKTLQQNVSATFVSPQGQETMRFLEDLCGWYDFSATDPDQILIAHGKRQALATIKTLIEQPAEVIVTLAEQQGGQNAD